MRLPPEIDYVEQRVSFKTEEIIGCKKIFDHLAKKSADPKNSVSKGILTEEDPRILGTIIV